MAVSTLFKHSEDKIIRQAYQRRQDEIFFNTMYIRRAEEAERLIEQEKHRAEQAENKFIQAEAENEKLRKELAKFKAQAGQ